MAAPGQPLSVYVIRLKLGEIKHSHLQVIEAMREVGVGVNLHYIPVHTQPYYERMGFRRGDYPKAEQYYSDAISLPIYPNLQEKEQYQVVSVLKQALQA